MSRPVRWVVVVVALQAVLIGAYGLIERARSADGGASPELTTAPPERIEGAMPSLSLRGRDGSRFEWRPPGRAALVHFWATWCPPCRTELPGLLALPEEHPVEVVAVALDREWSDVDAFLDGESNENVFLGDPAAVEKAFGVRSLPVTFLVGPEGRARFRFEGARNWRDPQFLAAWLREDRPASPR